MGHLVEFCSVLVILRVSIAMIKKKLGPKAMQRGKVLIQFIHCLSLKEEGSQGRNSGSVATWRQELKPLKEYRLLTFSLWLAQTAFIYHSQPHAQGWYCPAAGRACSHQLLVKKMPYRLVSKQSNGLGNRMLTNTNRKYGSTKLAKGSFQRTLSKVSCT